MNRPLHHTNRTTSTTRRAQRRLLSLLVAGAPLLASCGDGVSGASTEAGDDESVLAVVMADFHDGELPETVPAGTRIVMSNDSQEGLHELVAIRLDDTDDRTPGEIVGGDIGALLGAIEPSAVLIAPPGRDEQIAAVGDGTLTEPGRYLVMCVIPTGADPDEYLTAAATSDGPPQVAGGPPHIVHGMFAELTVAET